MELFGKNIYNTITAFLVSIIWDKYFKIISKWLIYFTFSDPYMEKLDIKFH